MEPTPRTHRLVRWTVSGVAALALGATGACADDGAAYEGAYDEQFLGEIESYDGDTVELEATVQEVLSSEAFTVRGEGVGELLVLTTAGTGGLEEDTDVTVTGTLHEAFDLPEVEGDIEEDIDDGAFARWQETPYVVADSVE
jgi:hypothetical protein